MVVEYYQIGNKFAKAALDYLADTSIRRTNLHYLYIMFEVHCLS